MTTRAIPTLAATVALLMTLTPSARAGLGDYLKKDDPSFAWSPTRTERSEAGTVYHLKLTSQVWQGNRWVHALRIYEPSRLTDEDTVLLFITGGNNGETPKADDVALGFHLARLSGVRVAVLPQVPNQPLLGGKTEDALIAETFVRFLDTQDDSWPLLFPMVKSAVKAMDAVQSWARNASKPVPSRFVVAGASKRGWTTWLTGASDPRVVAIVPMVIDVLNMKAQRDHAIEVWGKNSEEIDDYTRRGLTQRFDDPAEKALWRRVDPYAYREDLTLPKLLINGTNDRYWTLDALNLYWDDLKGPKTVVYVPNAGHNLAVNRNYALNSLGAFVRTNASKRPWPELSWKHDDGNGERLRLSVTATASPRSARLWVAHSETNDFRESSWNSTPMTLDGRTAHGETQRPAHGDVALFGDLEFETDGLSYHLSTQIRQASAKGGE